MSGIKEHLVNIFPEWEEEKIFGNNFKVDQKRIVVSDQQKNDPLRKAKIILSSYLVAEKSPITSTELVKRMIEEDGQVIDFKKFGFDSLDDLMQACPDEITSQKNQKEQFIYSAKTNEANMDLKEMVLSQKGKEKRIEKSFFSSSRNAKNTKFGFAFRQNLENGISLKSVSKEYKKRPISSSYESRVKDIVWFLHHNKLIIGNLEEGKILVTLSKLQESFFECYNLPLWKKKLTEKELYSELNKPAFTKYFKFFRLPNKESIFVEINQESTKEQKSENEVVTNKNIECVFKHLSESNTENKKKMFSFQNYKDSNSLESGPSFQTKENKFSSTRGSIQNRFGTDSSVTFENEPFGFRKGADIDFQSRVSSNNVPLKETGGGQSKQNWVAHLKEKPVDIYKNTFNTLFSVVRQKHRLNYDTLKSSEKIIVSHHANIFKTTSHIKGETFVTLKDQNITESAFKDSERLLRPMIEQDVTHLVKDCINLKQGFYQEKLEYFVPPRGFIIKCKTEDDEFKIAKITNKLSNFMKSNPTKMNYKEVMPGTPSFLVFFTDDETEYFRVLIVGNPLGSDINNKVLVTLVDVSEKYFVDANVEDLYHLPSEVSFEKIKPNFIFATLYGINGISSQYQDWITRALDTNKKEVLLYFYPGNKNTDFIPTIDYLCCDEMGQRRWFSQLLKNEDEIIQFDLMDKSHLNIDFSKVSTEFDDVNFMQFKSFKKNLNIEIRDDYESSLDDTIEHFESLQSTEFNQVENGFLEHFETMLEEKKMKQLFLVIALVDDMINSESHGNWIKLREKMAKELKNSFNIII